MRNQTNAVPNRKIIFLRPNFSGCTCNWGYYTKSLASSSTHVYGKSAGFGSIRILDGAPILGTTICGSKYEQWDNRQLGPRYTCFPKIPKAWCPYRCIPFRMVSFKFVSFCSPQLIANYQGCIISGFWLSVHSQNCPRWWYRTNIPQLVKHGAFFYPMVSKTHIFRFKHCLEILDMSDWGWSIISHSISMNLQPSMHSPCISPLAEANCAGFMKRVS